MAILDSPEALATTSSSADNDLAGHGFTLRHRSAAPTAEPGLNTVSTSSTVNRAETDHKRADLTGSVRRAATEEQGAEAGRSSGSKEEEEVEEQNADDERENRNGKGLDALDVDLAYRPSAPAHRKIKESPLSSSAIFKQSHAGLFNLCIVVLVAVNSRLIIENLMKYGWLIRAGFWFSSTSVRDWPLLMCCLSLPIFPLAAFLVEKLVQQKYIPEWVAVLLHIMITTTEILYPVVIILKGKNRRKHA